MPLAAQLFGALGDLALRAGWRQPRLFAGMSGPQEPWGREVQGEQKRWEGLDMGFLWFGDALGR